MAATHYIVSGMIALGGYGGGKTLERIVLDHPPAPKVIMAQAERRIELNQQIEANKKQLELAIDKVATLERAITEIRDMVRMAAHGE